jgi:hypothetical protein
VPIIFRLFSMNVHPFVILPTAFSIIIVLILGMANVRWRLLAGCLLVAIALALPPWQMSELGGTTIPSLPLLVAGLLLVSGLHLYRERVKARAAGYYDFPALRNQHDRFAGASLLLCFVLVAVTLYNLYWLVFWDRPVDSTGSLWTIVPVQSTLLFGLLLVLITRRWEQLAIILYMALVPTLLLAVSDRAGQVNYRALTESRAYQIIQAIEAYHADTGRYPESLERLTPRYLFSISGPVNLYGQDWCYEGSESGYKFGFVDHETWRSTELFGRHRQSRGNTLDLPELCAAEIAAFQGGLENGRISGMPGVEGNLRDFRGILPVLFAAAILRGIWLYNEQKAGDPLNVTLSALKEVGRAPFTSPVNLLRTLFLAMIVLSINGPWGYERLHVPAEYPCDPPNFRLDDDYCGSPLTGADLFFWLAPLFLLPMLTTIFLLKGGSRGLHIFHIVFLSLAGGLGLWILITNDNWEYGLFWGKWLYFGLAFLALGVEVWAFGVNRRLSRGIRTA